MDKKKRSIEDKQIDEQFEALADSMGITGAEDVPGAKERRTHSKFFTDGELDAMPAYTPEEKAALPEPWTARGEMLSEDKGVIQAITDKNRVAARIFVTGEVAESYIGEAATRLLTSVNDVYYENNAGAEPLFINTRDETVRMARFDPRVVWKCFHPDILVELVKAEINRLGVDMDPWNMEYFDFYQNMVAAIKEKSGDAVALVRKGSGLDLFYHCVYLSCLLLLPSILPQKRLRIFCGARGFFD
ncbi:MAG: hypothetical protein LBL31_03740 [Spirochaetaceae bacterium]|nr:hypothetical protein [Spirochaetaceae bacterium]